MFARATPRKVGIGQAIVEAKDVHKTYRVQGVEVKALRGVDLTISKGDMVAIMGPSGCGRTTLLNCLSGLDQVDKGAIAIDGKLLEDMDDNERTEYRAKKMGFVFLFYNLVPVLSALENVELPLLVSGTPTGAARRRAREVLAQVGLEAWSHHKPLELSGGQRQRVTIARALANQPAIVWADEPTGDLDSETSDEIMALMKRLNKENSQTFVLVTHDLRIGQMTNKIIQMRDGGIIRS